MNRPRVGRHEIDSIVK